LPGALGVRPAPVAIPGPVVYEEIWLPTVRGSASCEVRGRAFGSKLVVGAPGVPERLTSPAAPVAPAPPPAAWAAGDR
jgi:hypothetical protein